MILLVIKNQIVSIRSVLYRIIPSTCPLKTYTKEEAANKMSTKYMIRSVLVVDDVMFINW